MQELGIRIVNKIRTPEAIEKVRQAKMGNQWNIGKHHNQETKEKMSLARKLYWILKKAGKKDVDTS